ncbi:MAG: hypothetical protein QOE28_2754, partial [Solirubrobacteraceae bacterium]|nr:hypothetical protein [Solirubrobacteraceae bacterium]
MASATPSASSETSFPAFRGSPLWVDTTARRERWWFADGAWVDQGKLGAPVSFGLTHWCADRGLQGPTFDEAFALELHTSILRAQGSPDDVGHGEFPWFGVQILQERRLIADVYECGDVEQIVTALLERGPVLTALSWASDFMSDEVTAGAPIVRMSKGGTSSGTHMVLFNGIDLDLELDGVTGFARFKNTWGRGWADHGHALMSLDVLRAAFAGTAYLPLPEASALRTGVSPEVAIPAERPLGLGGGAGEVESFGEQSIGSDRWTTRDRMGYGAHADAIARAIAHPETVPPLTIGIRAPWGAGKTSLMRMIQERLEWPTGPPPAGAPAALREIHLKGVGAGRVTHGMLLRAARGAEPARALAATPKIESGHEAQDEARWRPTVWFNPWMYQTGEQIWAGLAHEIIRQVTARMGPGEREQFWLRLNLKRIDEQAVRRRIYTLVLARVLPWAAGALAMLLAGLVLLATGALTAVGAALTAAGPVVAAVASAASARRVLAERARGAVSEALGPTGFADLVRTPEYERQSGSLFLVQTDLVRVLELIATP